MKQRITSALIGIMLLLVGNWALANQTPDPMKMLKNTTGELIQKLKNNQTKLHNDPDYVYKIINNVLLPKVDVRVMSMSVLGRNAWRKASEKQRKAFTKTFTQTVIRTYASALKSYENEKVTFAPLRGGYQGKNLLTVDSHIVQKNGNKVPITYSLILKNGQWKIYDLKVEGVSLLQSFRSQFASELTQGKSVDDLIKQLQQHNQKINNGSNN